MALSFSSDDDFVNSYGLLLCVADGIGGVSGGQMASRLALLALEKTFYATMKGDAKAITPLLSQAVDHANATLLDVAANKAEYADMGATLSGICLLGERYWVLNAGDSRVYRYRNGLLKQLTKDDTLASAAVRSGGMTFEQAAHSPDSHILTNCLGRTGFSLSVEEGPELRDGDTLLVCSDGLYDMVDDDTLAEQLRQFHASSLCGADAAQALISLANRQGGRDNISVILVRVPHER
jgi:protein phosphatase